MADPWVKFYTNDWASDPKLRMCSLAARGLWIEMICIMHEAEPYGHLLVSGLSPTDAQLAVLVGTPPDQISELLGELESVGVFSRTRKGVIFSRKLTRMQKQAAVARKNGKSGGNPTLSKQRENLPPDNPRLKGGDKPQKPEARSQSKKEEGKPSSKKATRLSSDWVLPKTWGEWAVDNTSLPPDAVRREGEKFHDFWIGKSGRDAAKLDWLATWRNWCRNAEERQPSSKQNQQSGDEIARWKRIANG